MHQNQPYSLGSAIQEKIKKISGKIYGANPLFVRADQGLITHEMIGLYLRNLEFLFAQTPRHLSLAAERCLERRRPVLAEFFKSKISEEQGHHLWAADDLSRIPVSSEAKEAFQVCASMKKFNEWIESLIEEDPVYYLGYALFVEYLTVLIAPRWLDSLEANCGISRQFISAITKHVDADQFHAQDDLAAIDAILGPYEQETYRPKLDDLIERTAAGFHEFGAEIARGTA